jgi:hypothetical protein
MDPMIESAPDQPPQPRLQAIRTGLLIAGSALLGGLAVVLWNRSSLSRLRQPVETASRPSLYPDEDED